MLSWWSVIRNTWSQNGIVLISLEQCLDYVMEHTSHKYSCLIVSSSVCGKFIRIGRHWPGSFAAEIRSQTFDETKIRESGCSYPSASETILRHLRNKPWCNNLSLRSVQMIIKNAADSLLLQLSGWCLFTRTGVHWFVPITSNASQTTGGVVTNFDLLWFLLIITVTAHAKFENNHSPYLVILLAKCILHNPQLTTSSRDKISQID